MVLCGIQGRKFVKKEKVVDSENAAVYIGFTVMKSCDKNVDKDL